MDTDLRVGFIGLGKMGAGIARNIQKAGFPITVYNRTATKTGPFVEAGATLAASPREAAEHADVVFTCLMGDDSVREVLDGDEGLLAGLGPASIHVGLSTISPACATELARLHAHHGSEYLAAPVIGRPDVADAGELRTFVAGNADAISRCSPIVETYTSAVLPVGADHAVANAMKICVNYVVSCVIELMGQVLTFGEKSGVGAPQLAMLMKSLFPVPAFQEYAERIQARDFEPAGFAMTGGLKDVELFLEAASDLHVPLPFANIVRDKLLTAISSGMSDLDWSAIYEITRRQAGLD